MIVSVPLWDYQEKLLCLDDVNYKGTYFVRTVPLVPCWSSGFNGVYVSGCRIPRSRMYLTVGVTGFRVIDSDQELARLFVPVLEPSRAIDLARMTTGDSITDETHAEEARFGHIVHLTNKRHCGCGPHIDDNNTYLVTWWGSVTQLSSELAWEVTEDDLTIGLCID